MVKRTVVKAVSGSAQVGTVSEGEEAAARYLKKLGSDAGYKSVGDLVYCYLVPYAIRRLEALERYAKEHPKPKAAKKGKKS